MKNVDTEQRTCLCQSTMFHYFFVVRITCVLVIPKPLPPLPPNISMDLHRSRRRYHRLRNPRKCAENYLPCVADIKGALDTMQPNITNYLYSETLTQQNIQNDSNNFNLLSVISIDFPYSIVVTVDSRNTLLHRGA